VNLEGFFFLFVCQGRQEKAKKRQFLKPKLYPFSIFP
jgi:hypothetical protein